MKTVKVVAGPREGGKYPGFGAIGKYFISGQPQELDVTEEQYQELTTEPANGFLYVEVLEEDKKPAAPKK